METAVNSSAKWSDNTQAQVIATTTFISAFTALGLLGNCLMIGCFLKNRTERWKASTLLMINLCFMNVLDCVVNMSLVISTSLARSWTYNDQICRFHAFTIQLMNSQITSGLTALSVDRFVAVKESENYPDIMSLWKTLGLIVYSWIHALSLCIPVIADVIPSGFYPSKYLCSVASRAPLLYVIFLCLLCFIVPFLILVGVFAYIFRVAVLEKSRNQSQQRNLYTDMAIAQTGKTKELHRSRFTFFTFLLWLWLCAPHLSANFYELLRNSSELLESKNQLPTFTLPSELDTILTWARYSFPVVFAIASLCRKEVRNSAKTLFTCRRNNSVIDLDSASKSRSLDKMGKPIKLTLSATKLKEKQIAPCRESPVTPATFQVPVLFATSNGIHLHKFDNERDITSTEIYYTKNSVQSQDIPVETATKCDVLGSQSDLIQVEEDTSDYDSSNEVDRFSVSNPVSLKRPENATEGMHRSMSNPEVGRIKRNMVRPFGETSHGKAYGVMPGDSGIDISSSAGNSMSRNKNCPSKRTSSPPEMTENVTDISLPSAVNSISSVVLAQAAGRVSRNSQNIEPEHSSSLELDQNQRSPLKCAAVQRGEPKTTKQGIKNSNDQQGQAVSECTCSELHVLSEKVKPETLKHLKEETVKPNMCETSAKLSKANPPRLQPIQYSVSPARKKPKQSKTQPKRKPEPKTKNVDTCTHGDSLKDHHNSNIFSQTLKYGSLTSTLGESDWSKLSESFNSGGNMQHNLKLYLPSESLISQTSHHQLTSTSGNTDFLINKKNCLQFPDVDRKPSGVVNKTS